MRPAAQTPARGEAAMKKRPVTAAEAVSRIAADGARVMIGGFVGVGSPHRLIDEMDRQQRRHLTLICNDTARPGFGVGRLVDAGLVAKIITSHIGTHPAVQRAMLEGRIEVELVPQGTLAERIRAGAFGLGGVLTPTGVGTLAADDGSGGDQAGAGPARAGRDGRRRQRRRGDRGDGCAAGDRPGAVDWRGRLANPRNAIAHAASVQTITAPEGRSSSADNASPIA